MEKHEIDLIIRGAIVEVSPYAAELITAGSKVEHRAMSLVDLGINSIDYAQIAHIVMDKLGIKCPLDVFTCINKLDELTDTFYGMVVMEA